VDARDRRTAAASINRRCVRSMLCISLPSRFRAAHIDREATYACVYNRDDADERALNKVQVSARPRTSLITKYNRCLPVGYFLLDTESRAKKRAQRASLALSPRDFVRWASPLPLPCPCPSGSSRRDIGAISRANEPHAASAVSLLLIRGRKRRSRLGEAVIVTSGSLIRSDGTIVMFTPLVFREDAANAPSSVPRGASSRG